MWRRTSSSLRNIHNYWHSYIFTKKEQWASCWGECCPSSYWTRLTICFINPQRTYEGRVVTWSVCLSGHPLIWQYIQGTRRPHDLHEPLQGNSWNELKYGSQLSRVSIERTISAWRHTRVCRSIPRTPTDSLSWNWLSTRNWKHSTGR